VRLREPKFALIYKPGRGCAWAPNWAKSFRRRALKDARHGKSIYRGGRLNMTAAKNRAFFVADVLGGPPL